MLQAKIFFWNTMITKWDFFFISVPMSFHVLNDLTKILLRGFDRIIQLQRLWNISMNGKVLDTFINVSNNMSFFISLLIALNLMGCQNGVSLSICVCVCVLCVCLYVYLNVCLCMRGAYVYSMLLTQVRDSVAKRKDYESHNVWMYAYFNY